MFGICVMLVLMVPGKVITMLYEGFLPYNLSLTRSAFVRLKLDVISVHCIANAVVFNPWVIFS